MATNIIQATTSDITRKLNSISQTNKVAYHTLDFNITSTKTILITKNKNDIEIDISTIDSLVHNDSQVKQIFSIDIFISKKRKFLIKSKIFISKDKTQAYIKIFKNSKIPYTPTLEEELKQYINKEKAKHNILIDTQEGSMLEDIKSLVQELKTTKHLKVDTKIQLASSSSYTKSQPSYIHYLYIDEKFHKDLDRCFVYVKENEKIINIFLGENGKNGFDVLGKFKFCKKIQKINTDKLSMSENIIQEIENSLITVKAKISGVLTYKKFMFDINKELNLNNIDFKDCIYFYAPIDNKEIQLNIRKTQIDKDAVGANITLVAHSIKINGDIGSNVNIRASIITISGISHKTSKLNGAKIYAHTIKGEAEGDYIQAVNVEHGKIQGGEVYIDNVIGGVICGRDIYIKNLTNYSVVKASNTIDIKSLSGKYNDFFLTPIGDKKTKDTIQKIHQDIISHKNKYTTRQIINLKNRFHSYTKKGKNTIAQIKSMKEQKRETLPLLTVLHNIKNRLSHIKSVLISHKQYQENINIIEQYDDCIYSASVILHDEWKKDNLIVFSKISDSKRISFEPSGRLRKICLNSDDINDTVLL